MRIHHSRKSQACIEGKYFDCEQNIQTVVDNVSQIIKDELHELNVEFLVGPSE